SGRRARPAPPHRPPGSGDGKHDALDPRRRGTAPRIAVEMAEAFAKINRELRVGPRRPDGFHEIRSRFCTIDFSDSIDVEEAPEFELVSSGIPVPGGESNLVARPARALAGRLGLAPPVRIRLAKRIPAGAGLGGGSSDAAVTLLLLSRLWGSTLPDEELSELAAS